MHEPDFLFENERQILPRDDLRAARLGQKDRRADRRVSREREFPARGEDADTGRVYGITRLEHENRFGEVEFARDGLHALRIQPLGVEDDGQRITRKGLVGEDIKGVEATAHG